MPIQAGARKAGHLDAQNQAYATEADFSHQPLETQPALNGGSGVSEVVVDDHDGIAGPTELAGPLNQRILQPRRFLMALHLLGRRLANVHDSQSLTVAAVNLFRSAVVRQRAGAPHCAIVARHPLALSRNDPALLD